MSPVGRGVLHAERGKWGGASNKEATGMEVLRILRALCVGLACAGMLLPGTGAWGEPASTLAAARPAARETPPVHDVKLDRRGILRGVVVDAEGGPVAHAVVVVRRGKQELGRVETDGLGRFAMGPLRGGTYQLAVGGQGRLIRVWAAGTAPPAAKEMILVVVGGQVVRGELPLEDFFASDEFVVVLLAVGMIAAPIIMHNASEPVSPD